MTRRGRHAIDLTHHFLIAMPAMADPNFAGTLTYICEHNAQGALGVVVNRPTDVTLRELFAQVDLELRDPALGACPVLFGGPVMGDRGFVLHRPTGAWQSTLAVADDIALTTSLDILRAVARGEGPDELLVTLGYAGWGPGQLEDEILQNAWLTVAAVPELIFGVAHGERFGAAMQLLGIDPLLLSDAAGHA